MANAADNSAASMPSGARQAFKASAMSAGTSLSEAKRAGKLRGGEHAVADGGKIARPAAFDDETRQRAGKIRRRGKPRAGIGARRGVRNEAVRPRRAGARLPPGSVSGADSRCASRREPAAVTAAVDAFQQRAAPFAGERAHQFEIGAGRLIDGHGGTEALAQRRRQRRAAAKLRAFDIGDAGRRRGQLQPRQCAEGFAGRDGERTR